MNSNNTKQRRPFLLFTAALAGTALLPSTARAQTVTTWRLANEYPATSLPGEADTFFTKAVAAKSGGKLLIDAVPDAKSGLKTREQLAAVESGSWAMANSFAGALGDEHPLFLLSSLPFLAVSAEDARRLYDIAKPAYEKVFSARKQKLLYVSPWPASGIWSAAPVTDAAALKALKIRTYDKTGTEIFNRVGSTAQTVSFSDLPAKMAAGEINAVLSSGDGGAARKLWETLKHFSEINYAIPLSFGTVNQGAWNALNADTRSAVEAAAAETSERQWKAMAGRVAENYGRMRAQSMQIASPAPGPVMAALKGAAVETIAAWEKQAGEEGRAILEAYRRGAK